MLDQHARGALTWSKGWKRGSTVWKVGVPWPRVKYTDSREAWAPCGRIWRPNQKRNWSMCSSFSFSLVSLINDPSLSFSHQQTPKPLTFHTVLDQTRHIRWTKWWTTWMFIHDFSRFTKNVLKSKLINITHFLSSSRFRTQNNQIKHESSRSNLPPTKTLKSQFQYSSQLQTSLHQLKEKSCKYARRSVYNYKKSKETKENMSSELGISRFSVRALVRRHLHVCS